VTVLPQPSRQQLLVGQVERRFLLRLHAEGHYEAIRVPGAVSLLHVYKAS
jgi:hypothetical protein